MTRFAVVYYIALKDNPLMANMSSKLFAENPVLQENVEAYIVFVNFKQEACQILVQR